MWIPIVAFVSIFAVFVGTYWALIVFPERRAERELSRRLQPVKRSRILEGTKLLRRIVPVSTVPALQKTLSGAAVTRVAAGLLQQADLSITVGHLLLGMVFAALLGFAITLWLTYLWLAAVIVGVVFGMAPWMVVKFIARRRVHQFEEQFPEAIELIARALRAGHAFTTGLGMAAEELRDPVRAEFRLLHDRQNFGMPMSEAMKSLGERVPLLDARFFVTAVLTQRESGGNLSEVLDSLAALIRDRFRLRRQVRAMSAHGRITGWVLGSLPFAIAGLLFLIAPDHIMKLFTDPLGQRMVAVVGVLQVIGFYAMSRIIDIEI